MKRIKERIREITGLSEELIPSSVQIVGEIALFKPKVESKEVNREIGRAIISILKNVRTVAVIKAIEGATRKPCVEVVAGKENLVTYHREFNCTFKVDFSKVMFSKGNKGEKKRLIEEVKEGERIVDMFAGIGYFSLVIARNVRNTKIVAVDINVDAVKLLKENIEINKLKGRVFPVLANSLHLPLKNKGG